MSTKRKEPSPILHPREGYGYFILHGKASHRYNLKHNCFFSTTVYTDVTKKDASPLRTLHMDMPIETFIKTYYPDYTIESWGFVPFTPHQRVPNVDVGDFIEAVTEEKRAKTEDK